MPSAASSPLPADRGREDDTIAARVLLATTAVLGAMLSVYTSMQSAPRSRRLLGGVARH